MKSSRVFITQKFLARIRNDGHLAKAAVRVHSIDEYEPLSRLSTWALVCEEAVDTEYDPKYYEQVYAELLRRGFVRSEIDDMRVFAWQTAGWLNFEKMVWDWCSLDEEDIAHAVQWQLEDKEITPQEAELMRAYLAKYMTESKDA